MSTPIRPVVAIYLHSFGRDVPATYTELDSSTLLAVSIKADYESSYGDEDGWDEVPLEVAAVIPDFTVAWAQAYAAAHRASASDLLEEAEEWLRGEPSQRDSLIR